MYYTKRDQPGLVRLRYYTKASGIIALSFFGVLGTASLEAQTPCQCFESTTTLTVWDGRMFQEITVFKSNGPSMGGCNCAGRSREDAKASIDGETWTTFYMYSRSFTQIAPITGIDRQMEYGQVRFSWEPFPSAEKYLIHRRDFEAETSANYAEWEEVLETTETSFSDTLPMGLHRGYEYSIMAMVGKRILALIDPYTRQSSGEPWKLEVVTYGQFSTDQLELMGSDCQWKIDVRYGAELFRKTPINLKDDLAKVDDEWLTHGLAWHDTLNACYVPYYPWVFSFELGWLALYPGPDCQSSNFMWRKGLGWLYTELEWYPFVWSFDLEKWFWVYIEGVAPNKWYIADDGEWAEYDMPSDW